MSHPRPYQLYRVDAGGNRVYVPGLVIQLVGTHPGCLAEYHLIHRHYKVGKIIVKYPVHGPELMEVIIDADFPARDWKVEDQYGNDYNLARVVGLMQKEE
jgi:hypothetical protein